VGAAAALQHHGSRRSKDLENTGRASVEFALETQESALFGRGEPFLLERERKEAQAANTAVKKPPATEKS